MFFLLVAKQKIVDAALSLRNAGRRRRLLDAATTIERCGRRDAAYVQGQAPEPHLREYFYYIDHQGQVTLLDFSDHYACPETSLSSSPRVLALQLY